MLIFRNKEEFKMLLKLNLLFKALDIVLDVLLLLFQCKVQLKRFRKHILKTQKAFL